MAGSDREDRPTAEARTRILAALVRDLQEAGGEVTVSAGKVAARLGVSPKTFRDHLTVLCADGHLVKVRAGLAGTTLALPAAKASAAAPESPQTDATVRQRLRAHLEEAVHAAGGEVLTTSDRLADALGAKTTTIAYHLKALSDLGHIVTERAGRNGTRIRLGRGGSDHGRVQVAAARGRPPVRVGVHYCPFCGTKLASGGWTFCGACGQKVPV